MEGSRRRRARCGRWRSWAAGSSRSSSPSSSRGPLRDQDGLLHTLGAIGPWLVLLGVVVAAVVVPALRLSRWRWRLDDDELDLRHGTITEIRTIVPVARIQHVDLRRSLWAQLVGTVAVVVHTAAGTTEIPALTDGEATLVRDRLAGLIRTPDEL